MKAKKILFNSLLSILFIQTWVACGQKFENATNNTMSKAVSINNSKENLMSIDTATLGNGCFWCTEAVFVRLKGVQKVTSGYAGGKLPNPTYKEVCSGMTGHAEVVQIVFDTTLVSFEEILEVFWKTHDPTTLNRQGNDVGTQYRSVIFYHSDNQRLIAEKLKSELNASGVYSKPVVTEIVPYAPFYKAEDYHQDYFQLNPNQPYCTFVVAPKVEKFEKIFKAKLK